MRILLVQPPVEDFYDTDVRLWPIGPSFLKAALVKHHPDVEVFIRDYHKGHGRRTVSLPKDLAYLKDYYGDADQSPFCTFSHYFRFGATAEEIALDLENLKPDVVAISCNFTPYYQEALEVASIAKKILGAGVTTLFGGAHISAVKEQFLTNPEVDFIIYGEGEKPIVQFVDYLKGHMTIDQVSNLGYKKQKTSEFVLNPTSDNFPINELPFPSFDEANHQLILLGDRPLAFMVSSRSCPHRCSFCSVHNVFGTNYRRRTVDSVIEEIELRYHQGFRAIDFEDDNLTFYKPEMKELCRRLIARFPNKEMEFVAMNGISYLSLDQELLELMWQAGFTQLNLALVTSDKSVRESTKRPHTVEKYIAVVEAAIALGFKIVSYQILGLPGESLGSMIQTLQFNARFPVLLGASNFYLTPESPIAKNFPPQTKQDFKRARLTAMAIESEEIKRDTVNTLFITTRIINFLKGLPIKQNEEQSLSNILENPSALVWERPMLPREILGLELLQKLLQEQVLYKSTKKGLKANHHFSWEIFWSVWSGIKKMALLNKAILNIHLDDVETQEGSAISLEQGPIALSQ